ncbi:ATP-binding protein [Candidatus Accumulibacter phosphatis]|uniref:ATP-binding protein n=1 Tax=Candidatus Accumulibacter phosphatis TaxID=327160 RepID=UPI00110AE647|nr:ATP-binding protein [Candidatus Accumulibacter phosphatis]
MDELGTDEGSLARGSYRGGGLGPAHRGYAYQDLVAAYLLVRALVERFESVVIDCKAVDDDRFDDIEINASGARIRRQLKSSADTSAALSWSDFNSAGSSLRFDRLVNTMAAEGARAANEYRLSATWQPPAPSDGLAGLLVASSDSGTFPGFATKTFRLDASTLWPEDGLPALAPLRHASAGAKALSREEVVRFCERFVIEVSLPPASLDLSTPGPLEQLLLGLMSEQVGIGRYPNHDRDVVDAGALAIYVASTARTAGATLSPADIAQRLQLRMDFGRIAQAFPIDKAVLQERLSQRRHLCEAIRRGGVHLALAGPGSGKSLVLTQVAQDLRNEGFVVARHYCFLEPGDELVEQRVTTNVFFGNLLGDLDDAFKTCGLTPPQRFAAGLDALDDYLKAAADAGHRVVIIVDGLDHIARVRGASPGLSENETDIVERLATLDLPDNVALVVGSQPGEHLQALREQFAGNLVEHGIDPWARTEILDLARSYGVHASLESAHVLDEDRRVAILDCLSQRSDGNPLYARYLSRGLVEGLGSGVISDPLDWLRATPTIQGDIALYYRHLYESISNNAKAIADIVGVLEFSVNEAELREIAWPVLSDWVPEALRAMLPVLSIATGQGGLRIFHESFRRFMLEELARRGRRLSNVLSPVLAWLEARDFFADAKSYRFTLAVMRRAERQAEILQRVSTTFVQRSLQFGHPHDAIERNLELAADVAAQALNWPALVRCAELLRALDACFSPYANDWDEYWETYDALFGAEALASQLLFDGRPTISREEGLLVCERVDIAGATAPWREYLALPAPGNDTRSSYGKFDPLGSMLDEEAEALAIIRGRLRLGHARRIVRRIHENLLGSGADITSLFVRKVAKLLAAEISPQLVEQLIKRVDFTPPKRYILERRFACALLLGLADVAIEAGDTALAAARATTALAHAASPEEAMWCVEMGAPADQAVRHAETLASLSLAVLGTNGVVDAPAVSKWVASARLLARDAAAASALADARKGLQGVGWYKCWLRFTLAAAQAESAAARGATYDISAVFDELVVDTHPFTGSPRACDLYSIQNLITQSLRRALRLVSTRDDWQRAIAAISEARSGTATQLDREDSGPISAGSYFSVLLEHASTPVASPVVVETMEQELANEEKGGTYYSNHAVYRLRLARLHARTSNRPRAIDHWREASVFLLGYGFRKDIALFDVIDSVPALLSRSEQVALGALQRLQPLLSAVLRHTDGRETKRTPNAWFRALLKVNPVRAVELLCREYGRELGQTSWIVESAHEDALEELQNSADPMLLDALWETLLLEIEYENAAAEVANNRIHPLERLAATNPEYVKERFVRLCSQVFDDARHYRDDAVARLRVFAQKHGLPMPWTAPVRDKREERIRPGQSRDAAVSPLRPVQPPTFPPSPRFVDVLTTLRRLSQQQLPEESLAGLVALPLSYLISEMVDRGEELEAQRLIHFLARETPSWSFGREHPIALLGQLHDNAGHARLAAIALTFTFTASRGGGGWLNFGGRTQAPALQRAMQLDRGLTLQTLAEETARRVRSGGFSGVARHLIEQISDWGDHDIAAQAWEEAFAVLASRLPLPGLRGYFEPLGPPDAIAWSVDEALAALLLARISNASLPRKIAALSGFRRLLTAKPELFSAPLARLLARDTTVSTVQVVLQVLLETPADVSSVIASLDDLLQGYARGNAWTLSWLAEKLVERGGRPPGVRRTRARRTASSPSAGGLSLTEFADVGGVLNDLETLWPDLRAIVAHRMDAVAKDNDHFKHYLKERNEIKFGRARECIPGAIVTWPTELFLAVLDEALMGLHEHLWSQGLWNVDVEDAVACRILPYTGIHLALYASRVPRPDWDPTREAKDQLGDIVRVPDADTSYGGWIRLGLYEQSLFRADDRNYGRPDKSVLRSAAIVGTELDGTVPPQAVPAPSGDIGFWWIEISALEARMEAQHPQLIRLGDVTDWLGKNLALLPPLALRHRARLQPSEYGTPVRWLDADGTTAVVLRTWRVRDRSSDPEGHSTLGCDLLMRPDLLNVLEQAYSTWPLKELQQVRVTSVRDKFGGRREPAEVLKR